MGVSQFGATGITFSEGKNILFSVFLAFKDKRREE